MKSARCLPPLKAKAADTELAIAMKQQALYQLFKSVELEYHCYFFNLITKRAKQLRLRGLSAPLDDSRYTLKAAEARFETRLAKEFVQLQKAVLETVQTKGTVYVRLKKEQEHLQRTFGGKSGDSLSDLSQLSCGSSDSRKLSRSTLSTPYLRRSSSRSSFVA
jgi:hypothetical protein